jgi:hypothetical protein
MQQPCHRSQKMVLGSPLSLSLPLKRASSEANFFLGGYIFQVIIFLTNSRHSRPVIVRQEKTKALAHPTFGYGKQLL